MASKLFKILLIESDPVIAEQISSWLHSKASVVHIVDIAKAKEQAALSHWDLVITDTNSTELTDLDVTNIVKSTNQHTAVLIIAENVKVEYIIVAMQNHANSLIFKPLNKEEFLNKVVHLAEESILKKQKDRKIILAIGAHPDDVEFGCGGVMAKSHAENAQLNILTLSSGEVGGDAKTRALEAKVAADIQGASLLLGDFADTQIMNTAHTIKFIEQVVETINPTHVYTHSFYDGHQDHRNVYLATITACRQVPNIYSYLSPSSTVDFRPNLFVNINEFIEKKLKSIKVFSSQSDFRPYLQPDLIKATARYWGRFCNYQLAEPMEVIKEQFS